MSKAANLRPLIDQRTAMWAASLVMPSRNTDRADVAKLRAEVTADLPAIDAAARAWTGLGHDLPPTSGAVVGRHGWVKANLAVLSSALEPLRPRISGRTAIARRALGVQVGGLLGLLSTKVLGQFILPLGDVGPGKLVIVGPNLLDLADEFGPQAADIRRTVVLHEVTHRLQFDGVDWLGGHLRAQLAAYLEGARLDLGALTQAATRLPDAIAKARGGDGISALLEAVLSDDQFAAIERAQSLMTLLEGHGNAAMYGAADGVVADPEAVRASLGSRRPDMAAKVLTAVAGLEMKKKQYRDGEAFVTAVVSEHGTEGLNRAFADATALPTLVEIGEPALWMERVGLAVAPS